MRRVPAFSLTPDSQPRSGAPAERWLVDGGPAAVGIVGSVTRPFCSACDRTRITADGQVRSCLFAQTETDLCALLSDIKASLPPGTIGSRAAEAMDELKSAAAVNAEEVKAQASQAYDHARQTTRTPSPRSAT